MNESLAFPVVCIVVEKFDNDGQPLILIQRRTKYQYKSTVEYQGIWELPQGRIRTGETINGAAKRELYEETGLHLDNVDDIHSVQEDHILQSTINSFMPLVCTIDLEHNFIGMAIIVRATGLPRNNAEASDHQWINRRQAERLIMENQIFPLDVRIIEEYYKFKESRTSRASI